MWKLMVIGSFCLTFSSSFAAQRCSCQKNDFAVDLKGVTRSFWDTFRMQCVDTNTGAVTVDTHLPPYPNIASCLYDADRYEGRRRTNPTHNNGRMCMCSWTRISARTSSWDFYHGYWAVRMQCTNDEGNTVYDTNHNGRHYPSVESCRYDGQL